jgi:hypothetical protein
VPLPLAMVILCKRVIGGLLRPVKPTRYAGALRAALTGRRAGCGIASMGEGLSEDIANHTGSYGEIDNAEHSKLFMVLFIRPYVGTI